MAPPRKSRKTPAFVSTREPARLVIENVTPAVDGGRFAVKRVVGDVLRVEADIFRDGHDLLGARVRFRGPGGDDWRLAPMTYDPDADRWDADILLDRVGTWRFAVEAWTDVFGTWRRGLGKKVDAGQKVEVELLEGSQMAEVASRRARFGAERNDLSRLGARLADTSVPHDERVRTALSEDLQLLMERFWAPGDLTTFPVEFPVFVDRERAAFASWYEFFPRSAAAVPGEHGTFRDAEEMLPRIARLGFDVVYLPPIHPIGHTFRKGKNNTLTPGPDDVGSPWAIGNEDGGHDAIEPALGTVEDFERFVRRANELGLEIALDYALQCSPDHPWVKEHPDWFHIRPDGSIAYAENPPKKYQDIYPINFWCDDRENLWAACRDVLLYWIARGVTTFRVDNPHTKPLSFWEWVIGEVQRDHPNVVFLAEAFTRPKKLLHLAKLGFSQSYGYFTWKNTSLEIRQWIAEFSTPEILEYHRGNFFPNTPDILHEYLQEGGMPAFRIRLLLAATLSPLYGIYSGYEFGENVPVREGSEEYLDSEKYQLRHRDYGAPGTLDPEIALLNQVRRAHRALQRFDNLLFVRTENEHLLAYLKRDPEGDADLLVVVNLDPRRPHEGIVDIPLAFLGLGDDAAFGVEDLLTGAQYVWRGPRNYVRIDPAWQPGHLFRIRKS